MGLDTVELVLNFESTFQIFISDPEAEKMGTPRDVVDFIVSKLGVIEGASAGLTATEVETARFCVEHDQPLPELLRMKLSRADVALLVKCITLRQLGLPEREYGEDKHFVDDFGAD